MRLAAEGSFWLTAWAMATGIAQPAINQPVGRMDREGFVRGRSTPNTAAPARWSSPKPGWALWFSAAPVDARAHGRTARQAVCRRPGDAGLGDARCDAVLLEQLTRDAAEHPQFEFAAASMTSPSSRGSRNLPLISHRNGAARCIQELYASDPQFAAARFDEAVSAAIERPGRGRRNWSAHDQQAALRRVATLVARRVEPEEVFDAVTNEMRRYAPADCAGLWRYETSGEITRVAAAYLFASAPAKWPVGGRTPIAGNIPRIDGAAHRPACSDGQLRELWRADRGSLARCRRARGGGGADHH